MDMPKDHHTGLGLREITFTSGGRKAKGEALYVFPDPASSGSHKREGIPLHVELGLGSLSRSVKRFAENANLKVERLSPISVD